MTSFFTPRDPEQDTAVGSLSVHDESSALASSKVNSASQPLSYAGQCAAMELLHAVKRRYLEGA